MNPLFTSSESYKLQNHSSAPNPPPNIPKEFQTLLACLTDNLIRDCFVFRHNPLQGKMWYSTQPRSPSNLGIGELPEGHDVVCGVWEESTYFVVVHLNLVVEDVKDEDVECPLESFGEEDEDHGFSGKILPNSESSMAQ